RPASVAGSVRAASRAARSATFWFWRASWATPPRSMARAAQMTATVTPAVAMTMIAPRSWRAFRNRFTVARSLADLHDGGGLDLRRHDVVDERCRRDDVAALVGDADRHAQRHARRPAARRVAAVAAARARVVVDDREVARRHVVAAQPAEPVGHGGRGRVD